MYIVKYTKKFQQSTNDTNHRIIFRKFFESFSKKGMIKRL